MSDRLNDDSLTDLPAGVQRPAYDRRAVKTGIVHLGVGAFHRAHQAVYTDDVLSRDPSWGIVAASLRSPDTYDALEPQNGLYTVSVRSQDGEQLRVVGAITRVIVESCSCACGPVTCAAARVPAAPDISTQRSRDRSIFSGPFRGGACAGTG